MMTGLVMAAGREEGGGPAALLRIGGITLLERHLRMLRDVGVREIGIAAGGEQSALAAEVLRLQGLFPDLVLRPGEEAGGSGGFTLLTDASMLIDSRLLPLLAREGGERLALILPSLLSANPSSALPVPFAGGSRSFAGAAMISASRARELTGPEGSLPALLAEIAAAPRGVIDLSEVGTYVREMRRELPFLVMAVRSGRDNHRAKVLLLDAAQKKILDWPAWYIHRPLEKGIVYHLCELPLTPNQLSLVTIATAGLSLGLFAFLRPLPAMILALAVGVLDGLDGKQARVKNMCTRGGDLLDHISDKVYEFGWYIAIGYALFAHGRHGATPLLLAAAILLSYLIDWPVSLWSRKRFGCMLDDFGPFERRFRVVSGRRNTFMWTLLPFVLYDAAEGGHEGLYYGFWTIALYAVLTLLVRIWRFSLHLREGRKTST
jgi:phosphatidylglycerophosphate synthase